MSSSILYGLAHIVSIVLNLATWLVIISVALSWFDANPANTYVRMLRGLTEPLYRPIRKYTNRMGGPLDWAPLILLLIITFLQKSVPMYLMSLSQQLK